MRVFCAGSLSAAMRSLIADYEILEPADPAAEAAPGIALTSGPAGLLCRRIEDGEQADVFLSASPAAPRWLAAQSNYAAPILLCHNRLAVVARPGLPLTEAHLLDRLLDPALRLVSSTPGADPGGDYAMALFAALDQLRPGSAAVLREKVRHPFGGPDNSAPVDGMSPAVAFLKSGGTDLMVVYRTTARAACAAVEGASAIAVPLDWLPRTEATLTWRRDAPAAVTRFVDYLQSGRAAELIAAAGLEPATPR
ncbi:MAG: substrate-binding domain-containing protein [Kiloniellaceae bacterium]